MKKEVNVDIESNYDDNEYEVLGARLDKKKEKPIQILDYLVGEVGDGIDYVTVRYDGKIKNLLLHFTVYNSENTPYDEATPATPYIVIGNEVYTIASFRSIERGF